MVENLRLRPHHLLCTLSYRGKGYSEDFISNMDRVVFSLQKHKEQLIDLIVSHDILCATCPKLTTKSDGELVCEDQETVEELDRKVMASFNLYEGTFSYSTLLNNIHELLSADLLDYICSDCSWYKTASCKELIVAACHEI